MSPRPTISTRPRVRSASKAVIRYIHSRGMREGDHLSDQQELRAELGFSNDSLTPAMRDLARMGVITRTRGRGTQVVRPDAADPRLWSVAMPTYGAAFTPGDVYYPQLCHSLQIKLRRLGYPCLLYPSSRGTPFAGHELKDFVGLTEAHKHDEIDGIIAPLYLMPSLADWARKASIPICQVGLHHIGAGTGIRIDQESMVFEAGAVLTGQGCQRVALVCHHEPAPTDSFWSGFKKARRMFNDRIVSRPLHAGHGVEAGGQVAKQILAMPKDQRPDGVVVIADDLALGLSVGLVSTADYRPQLAVQTNREVPLVFPWPVYRFELNIEAMAERAVGLLAERLLNPLLPDEILAHAPVYVGLHASHPAAVRE